MAVIITTESAQFCCVYVLAQAGTSPCRPAFLAVSFSALPVFQPGDSQGDCRLWWMVEHVVQREHKTYRGLRADGLEETVCLLGGERCSFEKGLTLSRRPCLSPCGCVNFWSDFPHSLPTPGSLIPAFPSPGQGGPFLFSLGKTQLCQVVFSKWTLLKCKGKLKWNRKTVNIIKKK